MIMPINKLQQAKVTNAELGIENKKLAGYIKGTADQLCESVELIATKKDIDSPIKKHKHYKWTKILF